MYKFKLKNTMACVDSSFMITLVALYSRVFKNIEFTMSIRSCVSTRELARVCACECVRVCVRVRAYVVVCAVCACVWLLIQNVYATLN